MIFSVFGRSIKLAAVFLVITHLKINEERFFFPPHPENKHIAYTLQHVYLNCHIGKQETQTSHWHVIAYNYINYVDSVIN